MELVIGIVHHLVAVARGPVAAIAVAGLLLLSGGKAHAQELGADACPTSGVRTTGFSRALSGDAFLTRDNEEVRLAGILASGSEGGDRAEAAAEASRAELEEIIGERSVLLAFTGPERDRYGRLSAQVFVDGEWLQGAMLRSGLARAAPDVLTRDCARRLLDAEARARAAKLGHWADGSFAVLGMDALLAGEQRLAGSFQIVEAVIVAVGDFRGRYFLNFGDNRETDFTVTVSRQDMRYFRQSDLELDSLVGRQVRVRGWLETYNGPNMPISIPEAIEVID